MEIGAFSTTITPYSAEIGSTAEPLANDVQPGDITNPCMFDDGEFRRSLLSSPEREPLGLPSSEEEKSAEHGNPSRPHRVRTLTKVDGSKLTVDVDCQTNGANVTFTLRDNNDQVFRC